MAKFIVKNDPFVCDNCNKSVEPIRFGGSYRNHCPYCLFSKHMDADTPGDRANECKGLMKPIGVSVRRSGEYVLLHKCQKCGFERLNRIAGDDDVEMISKISGLVVK